MLIKLEWLGYRMVKSNNMFSRFHPIPERHGQTDRQTDLLYQYRTSVCWRAIKINNVIKRHSTKLRSNVITQWAMTNHMLFRSFYILESFRRANVKSNWYVTLRLTVFEIFAVKWQKLGVWDAKNGPPKPLSSPGIWRPQKISPPEGEKIVAGHSCTIMQSANCHGDRSHGCRHIWL